MAKHNDPLLVDRDLLQQAEALCQQRLKRDPESRAALRSLAEVNRKLGNLGEAAAAYDRLFRLDPQDQEIGYLQAVLGGKEWPTTPTGVRAAPFVLLRDWLPREFHDTLLPFFVSVREKFVPAGVGDGEYRPDVRETLDFPDHWQGRKQFRSHLLEVLPRVIPRLHLPPFEIDRSVVQVRAYPDGHFFKVHRDADPGGHYANRTINFVYYFHKLPRPYTGGELLLFDSDSEVKDSLTTAGFTRVIPEDNSIIFFPPNFYHSVVPVRCPSQDFSDSRFAINGHIFRRDPASDAASHR